MKNLFDIKDKVVVITGGSGFLGQYYVKTLSGFGATVVNFDINERHGVDITDEKSVEKAVLEVVKKYKRIDVLINNAALRTENFYDDFEDFPYEEWEKILKVNLSAMFLVTQKMAPIMKKQKSGSIINLSSIYGITGPDFKIYGKTKMTTPAVYSASKAGVLGLTRYLASYLGKYNIRVNTLTPGGVFNNQDREFVNNYSQKTLLGRMAMPHDLTGALVFLASEASCYMTGQNLIIDGGWTTV